LFRSNIFLTKVPATAAPNTKGSVKPFLRLVNNSSPNSLSVPNLVGSACPFSLASCKVFVTLAKASFAAFPTPGIFPRNSVSLPATPKLSSSFS
jgi:hypothetical protein